MPVTILKAPMRSTEAPASSGLDPDDALALAQCATSLPHPVPDLQTQAVVAAAVARATQAQADKASIPEAPAKPGVPSVLHAKITPEAMRLHNHAMLVLKAAQDAFRQRTLDWLAQSALSAPDFKQACQYLALYKLADIEQRGCVVAVMMTEAGRAELNHVLGLAPLLMRGAGIEGRSSGVASYGSKSNAYAPVATTRNHVVRSRKPA